MTYKRKEQTFGMQEKLIGVVLACMLALGAGALKINRDVGRLEAKVDFLVWMFLPLPEGKQNEDRQDYRASYKARSVAAAVAAAQADSLVSGASGLAKQSEGRVAQTKGK